MWGDRRGPEEAALCRAAGEPDFRRCGGDSGFWRRSCSSPSPGLLGFGECLGKALNWKSSAEFPEIRCPLCTPGGERWEREED